MALTITQTTNVVTIAWDDHSVNYSKDDLIVTRLGDNVNVGVDIDHLHKLLYSTVTTPTYASALLMEAALVAMMNNVGYIVEVFVATAGQQTFTTTFTATSTAEVFVNGIATTAFSIVAGAVVLNVACVGGEQIIIRQS